MSKKKSENLVAVEETKTEVVEQPAPVETKKAKKPKSKVRKILEWVLTGVFLALFGFVMVGFVDGMIHQNEHYGKAIRFGVGTFMVKTDSMEPQYKINTALITYLDDMDKIYEDFQNGQTIDLTFVHVTLPDTEFSQPLDNPELTDRTNKTSTKVDGLPMTHRVREIHVNAAVAKGKGRYTFITAGTNTRSKWMGWQEGQGDLTITQYQAFTEKEVLGRVKVNSPFLGGIFSFVSSVFGLLVLLLIPAFYLVITSVIDLYKAYNKEPEKESVSSTPSDKGTIDLSEEDKKRLKEELLEEMMNKKKGDK